ncbi:MAG: cyclase family protein [Chthoniobacterales bacterium]
MQIWDISRTLSQRLAPWPGDTGFSFDLNWKIAEGAAVNVGAITMSVHNGTHADAAFHFERDGDAIERATLDTYIGPAVVVDVATAGASIGLEHLASCERALRGAARLLLKTGAWPDSTVFPSSFPVIQTLVAEWMKSHGAKLLGVDVPSVDLIDSKDLSNHHALAAAGIAILESLDLSAIEPGVYNLSALPLKIEGGDGAPVRAILWRE